MMNKKTLALGGIVGPIMFLFAVIVSAAGWEPYEHYHQFISELGADNAPRPLAMNLGGFISAGIMIMFFAFSFSKQFPSRKLINFAGCLIAIFGIGVATSGILSCDAGCPQSGGTLENNIHNTIAPISFASMILGIGIASRIFKRTEEWKNLYVYSTASALLATVFLIALASTLETMNLTGLWQRLLLLTLFSWTSIVGVQLYRQSGSI